MQKINDRADYFYVSYPQPHFERGRSILQKHPEVRQLMGPNPWSALIIVTLVAGQLLLANVLQEVSFLWILVLAYLVGAFANHALYVLIHECTHNLVFRGSHWNRWMGMVCDVALVIPSSMGFRNYHLLHHQYLGEYDFDADLVAHWEAKLIGSSPWKKTLWLIFFSISQGVFRPMRLNSVQMWNKWMTYNLLGQILVNALIFFFLGPQALLYLFLSTFFALGLHPLGGRWIQEHYTLHAPQETYSYYGPLNKLALNMGYHNEHHDLMMIPWNNLPKLKKLAPEFYDSLISYSSWTKVLWRFITDPQLSPYSRVVHPSRRKVMPSSSPRAEASASLSLKQAESKAHGEEVWSMETSHGIGLE